MSEEIFSTMETKMEKTIDALKKDFIQIRSGKANPAMIEDIKAEYYGAATPLNQLGNITTPEPRMLVITPYDKSSMKEIERAILSSGLGFTPSNDGSVIRIILPELTGERRKELAKVVKTKSEEKKVAIRNIRRDANDDLKKESDSFSQDEIKAMQDKVQKITDSFIAKIDELAKDKEKEVLTV
ncbi:MAG: ribosome recycling factor [Leptospira sp.]|nr:ribosome recycling factor [Leptospira sp.]